MINIENFDKKEKKIKIIIYKLIVIIAILQIFKLIYFQFNIWNNMFIYGNNDNIFIYASLISFLNRLCSVWIP